MRDYGTRLLFLLLLTAAVCAGAESKATKARFISGVYRKGHNITEPRPRQSRYLKIVDGGFVVVPGYEAFQIAVQVSDKVAQPYFMQATLENPLDSDKPFVEEAIISKFPLVIPIRHGPVKGLKIGIDYSVTITIFKKKGDQQPLDSITQPVRSYIDTTGPEIMVKGALATH